MKGRFIMMKKISKRIVALAIALVALVMFTNTAKATTADELKAYALSATDFNGTKIIVRDTDKVKIEKYFANHEVSDEQATKVKEIADKAIAFMNANGAKNPSQLKTKEKKQQLLSYAQEAAKVLGLTVSYDASEERLDVFEDGKQIDSYYWGVELVQTGSTNYGYFVLAGVTLVAGVMLVVARKKIAAVNA